MDTLTDPPAPPPPDPATAEYGAEIRFGVVMYGGVSLAIYINGVTNELFEMACATPRAGVTLAGPQDAGTRGLYRRLSWLVGSESLRAQYADAITAEADRAKAAGGAPADVWEAVLAAARAGDVAGALSRTRLVVDVIAGTSAGGINGIFLAKALANGEQFSPLRDMWVDEGDLGLLLNDSRSYRDTEPPLDDRSAAPTSLLNSDRMYRKLGDALAAMTRLPPLAPPKGEPGSPLVEEVDLYVTTTDIEGSPVPLRLFDKVVYERRYKQSYHFSYPNGVTAKPGFSYPFGAGGKPVVPGNDFDPINNPFLAFAARCTSSFPFAFEPMTLAAVRRMKAVAPQFDLAYWDRFFPNLPQGEVQQGRHQDRTFGDGGYLDNKPFTYVVETLSQRSASVPIERKLVYVEPSPEFVDPQRMPDRDHPPDALSNALAALSSIPRYEGIREDLQTILQRNRRIERVERMVRLGQIDIENNDPLLALHQAGRQPPNWGEAKVSEIVRIYGLAFLPYLRLRMYATTDALADRLGARWRIDRDSDQQYALRALVRVWREQRYDDEGATGATVSAFLDQFDLDYRLRRLGYMLRKLDQLLRLLRKRCAGPLDVRPAGAGKPAALSEVEAQILPQLPGDFKLLPEGLSAQQLDTAMRMLGLLKEGLSATRAELLQSRRRSDARADVALGAAPADLAAILERILGDAAQRPGADAPAGGAGPAARGEAVAETAEAAVKPASLSRTLQENVLFRAREELKASGKEPTSLRNTLEANLQSMRVKSQPEEERKALAGRKAAAEPMLATLAPADAAPTPAAPPELERINARASALLGIPQFAAPLGQKRLQVMLAAAAPSAAQLGADDDKFGALNCPQGSEWRVYLGEQYRRFDLFDQMSFPLYYDTGTGEPATVEVVRVSPADATSLVDEAATGRRKLAGAVLGNFGAFLDRSWRLNDIMWGRLDGAERLIQALLPQADAHSAIIRQELIRRAHEGILVEALAPQGAGALAGVLLDALRETAAGADRGGGDGGKARRQDGVPAGQERKATAAEAAADVAADVAEARRKLIEILSTQVGGKLRVNTMLSSLLSPSALRDYVARHRLVEREPDPQTTLENAARAVSITGRVLQTISTRRNVSTVAARWLARMGLLLQGLVAVSLPGALAQRWWSHGIKVLYAFELTAVAAALLFGGGTRSLALTALGVTVGVHLASLVIRDYMRHCNFWIKLMVNVTIVVVVTVAALGALMLAYQGVQQEMCWAAPRAVDISGLASRMCTWLAAFHKWLKP